MGTDYQVLVQHVSGTGLVAPGWPANGMPIPSDVPIDNPHITADGRGGAVVVWERYYGDVRALRFVADGPTPVLVSLVSAQGEPGRALLTWFAAGEVGPSVTLYRRTPSSDWQALAELHPEGTGMLRYEDRDVTPGQRYGYRLGYQDGGRQAFTAETWLDIPARLALALAGFQPNPAQGDPHISFTLPNEAPATLELLDLSGRVLLARDLGSLGAGQHRLRLGAGGQLAAGIYWIRLRQGSRSLVARGVLIP